MARVNNLTVLSTLARDQLIDRRGKLMTEQSGGPAWFIRSALLNENIRYKLITGQRINVQILITPNGEMGKVSKPAALKQIDYSSITSPYLLISAILNDYNLVGLSNFKGQVFLDIQGYVRAGRNFDRKKYWRPSREITSNIFCLKGTTEEIKYIPAGLLKAQQQKLLIITKGVKGSEIYAFGKRYDVKPTRMIKVKNTIGAGDTFFAYFIARYIKTGQVLRSAKYATKKTSTFLQCQSTHHLNVNGKK